MTGGTSSDDFPVTNGTKWINCHSGFLGFCVPANNIFTTKLSSTGVILFSTYGGIGAGMGIAAGATGVYSTGLTLEPDCGALCTPIGFGDGADMFLSKLSPSGVQVYYQQIAGSGDDIGYGVAVDFQHNAWFVGSTDSPDFWRHACSMHTRWSQRLAPREEQLYFTAFASDGTDYSDGVVAGRCR